MWNESETYLPNNTLRVKLDLMFYRDNPNTRAFECLAKSLDTLSNSMLSYLESGNGANVEIYCDSTKFSAHEGILAG